jgi:hypothetical protein
MRAATRLGTDDHAETLVEQPYDLNTVVQGMAMQKRDQRKAAAA